MAITIDSNNGNIVAGGNNTDGDLILRANNGTNRIHLDAGGGNLWVGGNGTDGDIAVFAPGGDNETLAQATIHLDGNNANIFAGGQGADGDLVLRSAAGDDRIRLNGDGASAWLGGNGASGDVVVFAAGGDNVTVDEATIFLDGGNGNIRAGGSGTDGDVILRSDTGQDRIRMDAGNANIFVGGNGADGDILLFASTGDNVTTETATIHLNGDAGDIILRNADCAEDFQVEDPTAALPGTVMVIGENEHLHVSQIAYDRRVAGIVAGAGTFRPGIVLGRIPGVTNAVPIALAGRIYCRVDAEYGPVGIGDLLTTSPTEGHAMRAADPAKAFGAVIGKSLGKLDHGRGLVPMLVALQ